MRLGFGLRGREHILFLEIMFLVGLTFSCIWATLFTSLVFASLDTASSLNITICSIITAVVFLLKMGILFALKQERE